MRPDSEIGVARIVGAELKASAIYVLCEELESIIHQSRNLYASTESSCSARERRLRLISKRSKVSRRAFESVLALALPNATSI